MRDFIMRDEIKNFGSLLMKRDSTEERYVHVRDPTFQNRKKETMKEGGGSEQNKANLPIFLTERKTETERQRYGTCGQTMRKRDGGGTDNISSAEASRSPEESIVAQ